MGADLYIRSVSDPAHVKWEPIFNAAVARRDVPAATEDAKAKAQVEVDLAYDAMYPALGYFRDSYNRTSLLNLIGLSWWQDVPTKGGKIINVKKLLAAVEGKATPGAEHFASWDGTDTPESWATFFREKRARLIAFLTYALALGEPVEASL